MARRSKCKPAYTDRGKGSTLADFRQDAVPDRRNNHGQGFVSVISRIRTLSVLDLRVEWLAEGGRQARGGKHDDYPGRKGWGGPSIA